MPICKNCRYFDENTRSGYKGYCTWYKTFEDPDSMAKGCSHYEAVESSGSTGCYLTSACVHAKGLPDDCVELTTLRAFRDEYLKKTPHGREDVNHYYMIAPFIVENINRRSDSTEIWNSIFEDLIVKCVSLIHESKFEEAYHKYKDYTLMLETIYC